MSEKCLICEKEVSCNDASKLSTKGIQSLISASTKRKDGKYENLSDKKIILVHTYCRKQYTRVSSIAADIKRARQEDASTSSEKTRSPRKSFDFKTNCLFCATEITEEFRKQQKKKPVDNREEVFAVRTTEMNEKVMEAVKRRNDEWGNQVARRIINIPCLFAADAIYHNTCAKNFFATNLPTGKKRGRPEGDNILKAMDEIYQYLENNDSDDCQFSLDELMEKISGEKPSTRTVVNKLKEHYGTRILISTLRTHKTVVCFRNVGYKILNNTWYTSKCEDEQAERLRIVRTAAAIIKEDLHSRIYETSSYPPCDNFMNEAEEMIPQSLDVLLELLVESRRGNKEKTKRKKISLAHVIISMNRPRSFTSPILHGLALFIHRKFGSRSLLNLLSNLGFCGSYNDAQMLELSAIYHSQQCLPPGTFTQFVFDNADFNVATIDGLNTFHSMGGIKCITPAKCIPLGMNIEKLTSAPVAEKVGEMGVCKLQKYDNSSENGLKKIIVQNLNELKPLLLANHMPNLCDVLWLCSKWLDIPGIPEWKGFMQCIKPKILLDVSAVIPSPFINHSPSDYSTIYTALTLAAEECQNRQIKTCIVTFDQPLYIKAREIVASCPENNLLRNVVVRLGGFHMLMSFLGCIGQTMAGSGLKELLSTIFAPNSVNKMLDGHAYSRAVRAHLLVQNALAKIVLSSCTISNEEKESVRFIIKDLENKELTYDTINNSNQLASLQIKFRNKLNEFRRNGPTAALWVQYFEMIIIMKDFIAAERSGDWDGHLRCVLLMIPFFHASGHFLYAKSSHLYMQDMLNLDQKMTSDEFRMFASQGNFTIVRTGSSWSGTWSDMLIEQTLMCSMKSRGGLTHGRGITDSTLAKWLAGSTATSAICSSLEQFAGVQFFSAEQHVDFRVSRQIRNNKDTKALSDWFNSHPPFPKLDKLVSLSTGIVGSSNINCYLAAEVGKEILDRLVGNNFADLKQSRKNKVLSLASMTNTVKVNDEKVVVDPLLIFQRVAIAKKNDEDLVILLQHELAPFPLALFDEGGMRKNKKSALYDFFPITNTNLNISKAFNVIDGGFLLHRVKWSVGSTFTSICQQYINYVKKHYGDQITAVFDGYTDIFSTKKAEQKRRGSIKKSVDVNFEMHMKVTVQQEEFLSNENNKSRMIKLLSDQMRISGIETHIATGDADTSIIGCAIEKAPLHQAVAVIGEDVDLLVLLMALSPVTNNIFFIKPGRGNAETRIFSSHELQQLEFCNSILFLHGFSGCDTTSAIFRKGKPSLVKLFKQQPMLNNIASTFYDTSSTHDAVSVAGEKMFLAVYGAASTVGDLNRFRYSAFIKSASKLKPDLSSLPPTKGSAKQHSFRVYLQVQEWLGNKLPPEQWGWRRGEDGTLEPIKTLDSPAPSSVLSTIFCRCTGYCELRCGCRKAGMKCSSVCTSCQGSCTNGPLLDEEEFDVGSAQDDFF